MENISSRLSALCNGFILSTKITMNHEQIHCRGKKKYLFLHSSQVRKSYALKKSSRYSRVPSTYLFSCVYVCLGPTSCPGMDFRVSREFVERKRKEKMVVGPLIISFG